MELTKEDILMIGRHVDAAAICGISRMVFTKHHAYAISDDHTSCIVSPCEISIPKPVSNGVLTTDTIEQAIERAGSKVGNKGAEAMVTIIEMLDLYSEMGK
jgi:6,7-dimethyl-8-ribityllumazine synthase